MVGDRRGKKERGFERGRRWAVIGLAAPVC